jgi:hypothetical protein
MLQRQFEHIEKVALGERLREEREEREKEEAMEGSFEQITSQAECGVLDGGCFGDTVDNDESTILDTSDGGHNRYEMDSQPGRNSRNDCDTSTDRSQPSVTLSFALAEEEEEEEEEKEEVRPSPRAICDASRDHSASPPTAPGMAAAATEADSPRSPQDDSAVVISAGEVSSRIPVFELPTQSIPPGGSDSHRSASPPCGAPVDKSSIDPLSHVAPDAWL